MSQRDDGSPPTLSSETCADCGRPLSRQPWSQGLCLSCLGDLGLTDTLSRPSRPSRLGGSFSAHTPRSSGLSAASGSRWSVTRTLLGNLRGTRHAWIWVGCCLLSLYALLGSVYWFSTVDDTVDPGFTVLPRLLVRIPAAEAEAAGVRPRDRVLRVDGESVWDGKQLVERLVEIGAGESVVFELERPDREHYAVELQTRQGRASLLSWLVLLRGVVWVSTGLLLFWVHPGRLESWAFLASTLTVGLPALLPLPDYFGGHFLPVPHLLGRGWSIGLEGLIAPACVAFFLIHPWPVGWLARRPRRLWLLFLPALLWAALFLPTYPWYPGHRSIERVADPLYFVLVACTPAAVLVALGVLVWRTRRPGPSLQRAQLRALVTASLLSFPVPALAYAAQVVRPDLYASRADFSILLLNLPLLIFPPMVAYSIARHDLFAIDRMVARAGAYSIAAALVGLGVAGSVVLLSRLLPPRLSGSPTLLVIAVLVAVALLQPAKNLLLDRLERRLGLGGLALSSLDAKGVGRSRALRKALEVIALGDPVDGLERAENLLRDAFDLEVARFELAAEAGESSASASRAGLRSFLLRHREEALGRLIVSRREGRPLPPDVEAALRLLAEEASRALAASSAPEIAGYHVLERIGAGGMGTVYLAERRGVAGFSKRVALKEVRPDRSGDLRLVERFLREASIAARLSHPNLVETFDLGETDRGYFLAMEYVEGTTLSRLLRSTPGEPLPPEVAVWIASEICAGLAHAHSATDVDGRPLGLVHRDVSPQNVLLSQRGEVKLADFGIASRAIRAAEPEDADVDAGFAVGVDSMHEEEGRAGPSDGPAGKVPYMAPEQIRGDTCDLRTDLFAVGVLLYEMSTGAHPFRRRGRRRTWLAIGEGRFTPARELNPDLTPAIESLIHRALQVQAERRPRDAEELRRALVAAGPSPLRGRDLLRDAVIAFQVAASTESRRRSSSST
ncbi:MAG: hypothetical protein DWQ36_17705 [Acidobacteria bacterium]|nr:MAG: hypothetical protein DWQ30_15845 [Acidobacteriota bacterium]REK04276.1 MAG: hypothetical protein DWQ36_17705 [Acidobacteriota bacterium]